MADGSIKHISKDSFNSDVLESKVPVLVDYWAEWCGPCKMIAPVLDESAQNYAGRLEIAKVNVDEHQVAALSHSMLHIDESKCEFRLLLEFDRFDEPHR